MQYWVILWLDPNSNQGAPDSTQNYLLMVLQYVVKTPLVGIDWSKELL